MYMCIKFPAIASLHTLRAPPLYTLPRIVNPPCRARSYKRKARRAQYIIYTHTICTYSRMLPNRGKTMRSRCIENT